MNENYCHLWLTCANEAEADAITKVLLKKHLIACAARSKVGSDFLWQGKIDHNDEILLRMDSREDLFEAVEAEVTKLHSYETFVLLATKVTKISSDAMKWMEDNLPPIS